MMVVIMIAARDINGGRREFHKGCNGSLLNTGNILAA